MVSIRNPVAHGAAPNGLTIAALGLMDNLGSINELPIRPTSKTLISIKNIVI
jgi:hypothetical protein